jgi:hypothetical protein
MEDWIQLHNEKLHILYSSPSIRVLLSRTEMGGIYTRSGGGNRVYKILVAKPERKRPVRRCRHRS